MNNDDIIILTEEDLVSSPIQKFLRKSPKVTKTSHSPPSKSCLAKTKKGKDCKNKKCNNSQYCKRHHKQYSLEKPEDCPVCMEKLLSEDRPLKCGHWIHKDCLLKWKENICPMCRTEIKLTKKEQKIKDKIHNVNNHNSEEIEIPPQILDLLSSLLRGVPEYMRGEFVSGLLNIDIDRNSIIIGEGEIEEFSVSDIEEFPDIAE